MVNIGTNLCTESNCGLQISNVTGYKTDNPTGFWIEGTPSAAKEYMLNDVYFLTFLIKNNWDGTFKNVPIAGNLARKVTYNSAKTFAQLMNDAGITQAVPFTEDGYYSVYQLAIPSEATKNAVQSVAINTYYVKPDLTVWVKTGSTDVAVNLATTITGITWETTNIVNLRTDLISKCFLEGCLSAILEEFSLNYAEPACCKDTFLLKALREKRDLLFALTNTIEYYIEIGQYYKAAKLISDVSFCNICQDYIIANPDLNCHCNG